MLRRPINSNVDNMRCDMKDCSALVGVVGGGCNGIAIAIYAPDDQGRFEIAITLDLFPEDLTRWDRRLMAEAHATSDGVVFADDSRLAA